VRSPRRGPRGELAAALLAFATDDYVYSGNILEGVVGGEGCVRAAVNDGRSGGNFFNMGGNVEGSEAAVARAAYEANCRFKIFRYYGRVAFIDLFVDKFDAAASA
jgi:hypothetical protein